MKRTDYCVFKPGITTKATIRETVESHPAVAAENKKMDDALARWWDSARRAIEALPHHNRVAQFRREFIGLLKKQFGKIHVLNEFQQAGIFVNWWEAVRWDMKAIVATGWTPSLIPDDYIENAVFKDDLDEIDALEAKAAELEADLSTILDEIEMNENGDEENGKTAKAIKTHLKQQIAYLREMDTETAKKEVSKLSKTLESIETKEKELKTVRRSLKEKEEGLEKKSEEKRQSFTEAEARELILQKFRDIARSEMHRYLKSEKNKIVGIFEKLWDKYRVTLREMEAQKKKAADHLAEVIRKLDYEG